MTYDRLFFDYVDQGAIRSARIVVAVLAPLLRPGSVLDVGCGRGGWLRVWQVATGAEICGVDGAHVDRTTLHIPPEAFRIADLAHRFDLGRRFDLAQCLEVGEHLPAAAAETLVDSLAAHADVILFGAAVPGQGGTQHVNEQPLEYWRDRFFARGYTAFDGLRPRIAADTGVEPWYRFNPLLYANAALLRDAVPTGRLADYAPLSWRLRRAVVRHLPVPVVDQLARANAALVRRRGRPA